MTGALSLRARLTAIILAPLVVIALLIGAWAIRDAQIRADDRFNRALLTAALAVSRDVAVSGGDALSPETNALLRDGFAGPVFYHVRAPDGAFVTGYATPPVPRGDPSSEDARQALFEGIHQSREVQAIRFVDTMQVDGLSGDYTVTIWQERAFRTALARDLVQGTILVIALLVATVALVVWFGVRYGLRPLNDLEDAIARRSSDELYSIRRDVPEEVTGIVRTLNSLFEQLAQNMAAQADFISNAAHQLRNPIAGVLSMAEAVAAAPTPEAARTRSNDLLDAARDAADLSQKILLLERAKAVTPPSARASLNLSAALLGWSEELREGLPARVRLATDIVEAIEINADETMLREAIRNLVDNALRHGGNGMSRISISLQRARDGLLVAVEDDGRGIPEKDLPKVMERFGQVAPSTGSGLGISIADAVARGHGGSLALAARAPGLRAELRLAAT